MQPEPGADVVEDEQGAVALAGLVDRRDESLVGQEGTLEEWVMKRCHHHGGDVADAAPECLLDRLGIVPPEVVDLLAVWDQFGVDVLDRMRELTTPLNLY